LVQKRIFLENGFGPGQITIPDSISSGNYTIRAYTSWMKNFLPENCFMKDIKIFNAFNTKTFRSKAVSYNSANINSSSGSVISGFVLRADNQNPEVLEITVNANDSFRKQNNNRFYLFIQTHGKIDYVGSESLSGVNSKIVIPKKVLSEGINQITAFDSKGLPVSDRYIYTRYKENPLTIHSPDSCSVRSKVKVGISIEEGIPEDTDMTNLSISVAPVSKANTNSLIGDYLIFGSEFGLIPWQILNGRKLNDLSPESMDSLLLNLNSNWIRWKSIISDEVPVRRYDFENKEHSLYGKLLPRESGSSVANEFVLLSTPGKIAAFQYARTDKDGNFKFRIHIDGGVKDLIIQPDQVLANNKVIIESSFSDQYLKSKVLIDSSFGKLPSYIPDWSVNYQVMKIYGSTSAGDPLLRIIPQPVIKRFYGKPDVELFMADYIKLPVMQEVFFELIPGVSLKSRKSSYEFTILDPVDKKFHENPPVMLVDGVVINDASIIAGIDPENVEEIDAVKQKYVVGDYLFYGLINVISKGGNFGLVNLPNNAVRIPYRVIDPVNTFISPDYSSGKMKNIRIPDMRNTLYWNPSIKPDKTGNAEIEFWSADNDSEYMINIQGITSNGKHFSIRKVLKVK
jgi:hypothetical protein